MGWLPVPNPIAFTIFGVSIRWYAICLTTGMIVAVLLAYYRAPKKLLSPDRLLDFFVWCAPAGIIGARAYYVIFRWSYYKDHLDQILHFRGGGLAIHGTIIAVVISMYFVAKHYKEDLLSWIELTAPCWPLAQAIGRWGNYFNSEAHGIETNLPWAIFADGKWVHPTFLYESIWCFLLFIFILWWDESGRTQFKGQLVCFYMIFYSLERFFVESLRTDSLYIGPFRQAMVLSACAFVLGIVLYIIFKKKYSKDACGELDSI
ncbi:MAG: prolipoprotein diacylglyceryl transferase [Bacillota bacterium]|nr:prolipoprotein diacylglyceryl transferase [Bacillota bacterium]